MGLRYRVIGGHLVDPRGRRLNRKDPEVDTTTSLLSKLSETQKQLICDVVGSAKCDKKAFSDFSKLPPAVRELKLANVVSQKWAGVDFVEDPKTIDTKKAYTPSFVAKLEEYQVAAATLIADCNLEMASIYDKKAVICDPAKLTDYQKLAISKAMLVPPERISPRTITDFFESIRQLSDQERLHYWKNCVLSFVTVGDLVHKLRYQTNTQLNFMEKRLVCAALGRGDSSFTSEELENVKIQMTSKVDSKKQFTEAVRKILAKIASDAVAKSSDELWKIGQLNSDYRTLLDFYGLLPNRPTASIDKTSASVSSIGQNHEAEEGVCQDSAISLVINSTKGPKIYLDCVFDGVGGHGSGEVASAIAARSVAFSAVCGLIRNPEEARRAVVLADYGILFKSVSDTKYKNMGTTVVISFVCGNEFYGIHTGDSSYSVYRNGDLVFKSLEHSRAFTLASIYYPGGSDGWCLASTADRLNFLSTPNIKQMIVNVSNGTYSAVVDSALGSTNNKIEINNGDRGPILLKTRDNILTQSDGTGDTVSDEESGLIIARNNIQEATKKVHQLAVDRVDTKGDDKSVIVREIS